MPTGYSHPVSDKRVNSRARTSAPPERLRALAALKADFRIVVLFDSERCESDAFVVMWRLLSRIRSGTRVDVRFWQCETMKQQNDWGHLHSDLVEASAVIIATEGAIGLRPGLAQWRRYLSTETETGELVVAVRDRGLPFLLDAHLA